MGCLGGRLKIIDDKISALVHGIVRPFAGSLLVSRNLSFLKRLVCLLFFPFIGFFALHAETSVEGEIASDTTWKLDDSPFVVKATLQVTQGVTLTIESGVVVNFKDGQTLQVDGVLVARGSEEEPIKFKSTSRFASAGQWGFIRFSDSSEDGKLSGEEYSSGSILEHCVISHGGGASGSGAIQIDNAAPLIISCGDHEEP